MNNTRFRIPYVEFYITNVCNLACTGCNRFNNYNFRGYQNWNDYAEQYEQWAKIVDIDSMAILGGEPLLNPSFMSWLHGVSTLWPNRLLRIISNGFQLNRVPGLYQLLKDNPKIELWIGIHNKKHKKEIIGILEEFCTGDLKLEFHGENQYQQNLKVTDANGVKITIEHNWWFHQGAIINDAGVQRLHASDPDKAHKNCHMKTCHHFIRGKLYKCGVVALLPEYDQQHTFDLTAEDRELMLSYQPLTLEHSHDQKKIFIQNLKNPIPQCQFCPEEYHGDQIAAEKKKDLPK